MTAVLQATDALRRDRLMASLDDNQINYSASTDWRLKYSEVADMLAETRAELDDFHQSSKELEDELIRELDRTEKAQQDLKVKVAKAENDRDEWKSKFMSLQTTHNTTTTSLQRELDKLRQEHQATKVQLRDLEMGNDDLERNERAVSSSLADIEAKYSRALEEKILLEHELLDKANLEEESQRLKDELRDANVEISILKDQIPTQSNSSVATTETSSAPSSLFPTLSPPSASEDDLLNTPPPPDLQLSDLSPSSDDLSSMMSTPRPGQSTLLQRAGFQPTKSHLSTPPSSGLARSSTLPSITQLRIPSPRPRPPVIRNPSMSSMNSTASAVATAPKSKGVQMVSEMRARVKVLEQKIHTRVPRLRMGSLTGRPNANTLAASTMAAASSPSTKSSKSALKTNGVDERSVPQRRNADNVEKKGASADTSGWVLIMEDSPPPNKDNDRERRRTSSPSAPTAFRPMASTSAGSPTTLGINKDSPLTQSTGLRRPQSRLSAASLSTATTTSSIPTPSSRPATPTFLPVPTTGLYGHASTAGMSRLKRSTGPNSGAYAQAKRSSLGSSTAMSPTEGSFSHRERPVTMPPPPRPATGTLSTSNYLKPDRPNDIAKGLPQLPNIHANITVRPSSKLPISGSSTNLLGQSRIGRPSSSSSGRRSAGGDSDMGFLDALKGIRDSSEKGRQRAGSTNIGKNGL